MQVAHAGTRQVSGYPATFPQFPPGHPKSAPELWKALHPLAHDPNGHMLALLGERQTATTRKRSGKSQDPAAPIESSSLPVNRKSPEHQTQ